MAEKEKKEKTPRQSHINEAEAYPVAARNSEIDQLSVTLTAAAVNHQVIDTDGIKSISVEDGKLLLINEYFYNPSIKKSEWKIRVKVGDKCKAHYKWFNSDRIIASIAKHMPE